MGFVDPRGLARFGFRPLGDGSEPFAPENVPDGSSNLHNAHEQLWFDDSENENVGFFAGNGNGWGPKLCGESGEVRSDRNHARVQYSFIGPVYNDELMRKAVENITPNWNNHSYCLTGSNCQNFADAVRTEYNRLSLELSPNGMR